VTGIRDPRLGTLDVFVIELGRNLTRRLTSDRGTENHPAWSPDGTTIVYGANRRGPPNLQARAADASGREREIVPPVSHGPQSFASFTPDGRSLVYVQARRTGSDIMLAPFEGGSDPVALAQAKGRIVWPQVSPDGRWLAYAANESGRYEVYVQSLREGRGRRQVSRDGGTHPVWRRDGKELIFLGGADRRQLMAADITPAGEAVQPGAPRLLFSHHDPLLGFDVMPGGQRFLLIFSDPIAERGTLSAVLNWTSLVGRSD